MWCSGLYHHLGSKKSPIRAPSIKSHFCFYFSFLFIYTLRISKLWLKSLCPCHTHTEEIWLVFLSGELLAHLGMNSHTEGPFSLPVLYHYAFHINTYFKNQALKSEFQMQVVCRSCALNTTAVFKINSTATATQHSICQNLG